MSTLAQNQSVTVAAPASSANLGPGFDALGIALALYNTFTFTMLAKPALEQKGREHLALTAMRCAYKARGEQMPDMAVEGKSDIPVARGLGSSAACIVAGIVAANAMGDLNLTPSEQLDIATKMEGHPDNVAPALLGGLIASVTDENGHVWMERRDAHPDAAFYAIIPSFPLPTKKARQVLPKRYTRADAVFNISRAVLTFTALSEGGHLDNLCVAMQDKLHQPMRAPLIPGFYQVQEAAMQAGALSTALSGAGPTILAIARRDNTGFADRMKELLQVIDAEMMLLPLEVDMRGAYIV